MVSCEADSSRTSPASVIPSRPPTPYEEVEAEDLRNRLVLVDENSGEVLGSLASNVAIREDANISAPGHEKDPVIVDIPDQDQSAKDQEEAYIHVSTWEESDPLMRTATLIRCVFNTIIIFTYHQLTSQCQSWNYSRDKCDCQWTVFRHVVLYVPCNALFLTATIF